MRESDIEILLDRKVRDNKTENKWELNTIKDSDFDIILKIS